MRPELPSGTVTFLFTDVEGSTRLLRELGAAEYATALAEHRRVVRDACVAEGGIEVDTQGDAFFFAFPTAPGALAAARALTAALGHGPVLVRVGVHTGTPLLADEGYVGEDVHRAARIAAAGHGGQVLVSFTTAQLVDAALVDLGEHRFKDLDAPERVFQLGERAFPPLASGSRANLPRRATPFLGRERELREIVGLIARGDVRLVTLTGSGGTGKTRLALAAAAELAPGYEHGVWWVPLASVRDPASVPDHVAQALGARVSPAAHIGERSLLLVLDNFEQIVDAATYVAELLERCSRFDVLVTSREPLRIAAEREYAVTPMILSDAIELFAMRAEAVRADFVADDLVGEICGRLDCLPLAIELAAARVKLLTLEQIHDRLGQRLDLLVGGARDTPEHQRALRATIEWSYDLLTDDEQVPFARQAVFSGGFTLEAAEDVAGTTLDALQSLVEKSLVRAVDGRYHYLETVREYALERLDASGEREEIADRHAAYYARLADGRGHEYMSGSGGWRVVARTEARNLDDALDRCIERGRGDDALALVSGIWPVWNDAAHAVHQIERALDLDAEPVSSRRAYSLAALAVYANATGERERAERTVEEALSVAQSLNEPRPLAVSLSLMGSLALNRGDYADARSYVEQALAVRRTELGGARQSGNLAVLSDASLAEGDLVSALRLAEQAVTECRRDTPDDLLLSEYLGSLGEVRRRMADYSGALRDFSESVRRGHEDNELWAVDASLEGMALVWAAQGDVERAARLGGALDTLREALNLRFDSMGRPAIERVEPAWSEGRLMTIDEAVAFALESQQEGLD